MKKIYSILSILAMSMGMSAQVVLFQDQFDSYLYGTGPVANDAVNWSNWSTGNSDGFIDTAYAYSGANSCRIQNQTTDLVLPIGPYTAGKYAVHFQMLIPTGSTGAYFNALHDWSATQTTYEWGLDVFFDGTGAVSYTAGFVNEVPGVSVPIGEWFDVELIMNLDVDSMTLMMQGNTLFTKQWSLNNADGTAGLNQIAGVDFFGTDAGGTNGWYYIDDVQLLDMTNNVNVDESSFSNIELFPNPAQDHFLLNNGQLMQEVSVFNAQGQLIYRSNNLNPMTSVSTADWPNGVYQVMIRNGNECQNKKLMIQN
jgi:hypothetical protein